MSPEFACWRVFHSSIPPAPRPTDGSRRHGPFGEHRELFVGDDGGDLDDAVLIRVEPGHLEIDPDQVVFAAHVPLQLQAPTARSTERTLHRPAAEHVQVRVEDDLPAFAIDVHRDTVARQPVLARRCACAVEQQRANELASAARVKSLSVATMRLRDHEAMKRRLRMNVLEREDRVVLVDSIGGKLARHDLAEQAIRVRGRRSCALLVDRPTRSRGGR